MRILQVVALAISLIFMTQVAFSETTENPKSVELRDDSTLKDVMASQYFKIVPVSQVEIKDLKSFVTYKNDNQTIKCSFYKELTQSKVKLALAANSIWENSTGPFPISKFANPNQPTQKMRVRFEKGEDNIDLSCEFADRLTGMIDDNREEDKLRAACESKAGIFTRYSRKEYDYACDYRLKYSDLKKLFQGAGFNFEVRHEPPTISVVVLGEEAPMPSQKKKSKVRRLPSSEKPKR